MCLECNCGRGEDFHWCLTGQKLCNLADTTGTLQVPDVQSIPERPPRQGCHRCINWEEKEIIALEGFRTEFEYNLTFFEWQVQRMLITYGEDSLDEVESSEMKIRIEAGEYKKDEES